MELYCSSRRRRMPFNKVSDPELIPQSGLVVEEKRPSGKVQDPSLQPEKTVDHPRCML